MIIWLSALVCLVGMLIYAFAANPKAVALGKDMFWVGLLVFLIQLPAHTVNVLSH